MNHPAASSGEFGPNSIKGAIKIVLLVEDNENTREDLKTLFISLAHFITDEKARASLEVGAALNAGHPDAFWALGEAKRQKWAENDKIVSEEMAALSDEIENFVKTTK